MGRRRILTNAHVVIQDSTRKPWSRINVYFKPAKLTGDTQRDLVSPVEGKVIAWDPALDLALVEVAGLPAATSAIALAHPDTVSVGDRVAAIGHPEQGGLWTLTTGVISTLQSNLGGVKGKDAFQTDTSINRGNSGGPLLDSSGRLVGVNTSMSAKRPTASRSPRLTSPCAQCREAMDVGPKREPRVRRRGRNQDPDRVAGEHPRARAVCDGRRGAGEAAPLRRGPSR